jgi:threonyl-tRNA synthetase
MDQNYLQNLRHSCAHLLAKAVIELWPNAKNAIGPAIENGFYQDFDLGDVKISDSDLPKIEEKMRAILKNWKPFEEKEVNLKEAEKLFAWNSYKVELAREFAKAGKKLTVNDPGGFFDLCKGNHCKDPKNELKNFKLLSIAGAYWRGDEKNKMLTRIYGTYFPTKEELDKHLWQLEESKKRDHRKLGKELELFLISEQVGPGLPIFLPKGTIIRDLIEGYLTKVKKENGYEFVWSPHIARSQIYHTSKHWGKYEAMFNPMKLDKEEYVLKPMNCPHHFQVYLNKPRSYKDLPFRISENGTVYRNEKSGEVSGLVRVRAVTIDDTHTVLRLDQISSELEKVLVLIKGIFNRFGFSEYRTRVSVSDPKTPEKYLGTRDAWEKAEASLKARAEKLFKDVSVGVGEAAFYGPKIDVMVKDSLGREWQLSTVQLDYNQPENFNMTYVDENGKEVRPAVLHIAMVGAIERFIGILIEHYAGAFPLWLSPTQVEIIPISDKHLKYAQEIKDSLTADGFRAELNKENKTIGYKIRQSTLKKIPYMIIIGEKEFESYKVNKVYKVTVRTREGKDLGMMDIIKFEAMLKAKIEKYL